LSVSSIGKIIFFNTLSMLHGCGTLFQSLMEELSRRFNIYSWVILLPLGFVVLFGVARQIRSRRVLPCFLAGYLLMVLVWPWPPGRFLVVLLPFLLAYALSELWQSPPYRVPATPWRGVLIAIFGILLVYNLNYVILTGRDWKEKAYPYPMHLQETASWSSYKEIFAWIATNTNPTDTLCSAYDSMIYLYTGRVSFRPYMVRPASLFYFENSPPLGEVGDFIEVIDLYRPRYLIQTAMPGFREEKLLNEFIENILENYPGWLTPVFVGSYRRFAIYEIVPGSVGLP